MDTRRAIMRKLNVIAVTGLAGCSAFADNTFKIGEVSVSNYCFKDQVVQLMIKEDGDEIYREAVEMESAPTDSEDSVVYAHKIPSQPPKEAGDYQIYARLENDDEWTEADGIDRDTNCIDLDFQIKCGQLEGVDHPPSITIMGDMANPNCTNGD